MKNSFALMAVVFTLISCAGVLYDRDAHTAHEKGLALFNQGKYAEALPHFQKAINLDPDYSSPYLYLGRSYLNLSRWTDAIHPLRTAYRLSPQEFKGEVVSLLLDALIGGAMTEFKKGNFKESARYLRETLILDPESERAQNELIGTLIALGSQLLSDGNISDAIHAFAEAIELSPDNFEAYVGLAKAFLKKGNYLKALETANKAITIDPGNREAQDLIKELLK